MKVKHKLLLAVVLGVSLIAIIFLAWRSQASDPNEVTALIARRLGIDTTALDDVHLNYSLLPGRRPGAILDGRAESLVDTSAFVGRANYEVGPTVHIDLSEELSARASVDFPFLTLSPKDLRRFHVVLQLDSFRIGEVSRRVLEDGFPGIYMPVEAAPDTLQVILTSWEARIQVTIRRKEQTDLRLWERVRARLRKEAAPYRSYLVLTKDRGDAIQIVGARPQVLAFKSANICSQLRCGVIPPHERNTADGRSAPSGDARDHRPPTKRSRSGTGLPVTPAPPVAVEKSVVPIPEPVAAWDSARYDLDRGTSLLEAKIDGVVIEHVNTVGAQEATYLTLYFPFRSGFRRLTVRYRDQMGTSRDCAPLSFDADKPSRHFFCEEL